MTRLLLILAANFMVASTVHAKELPPGRGYYRVSPQSLEARGFPDDQHNFWTDDWGVLTGDDGHTYGPGSFYDGDTRLMHPNFTKTLEGIESRWNFVANSQCCSEALLGRFLELLDMMYVDISDALKFESPEKLRSYSPLNLKESVAVNGKPFFFTHRVDGGAMIFQDVPTMFRRTLIGHVVRAAISDALLDLKCKGRLEPWFQEGISSYLAQEGAEHLSFMLEFKMRPREVLMSPAEMRDHIYPLESREMGRIARYNAFLVIWNLSENHGWDRVLRVTDYVAEGLNFDQAMEKEYGLTKEEFWEMFDPRVLGELTETGVKVAPSDLKPRNQQE